MSTHTVFPWCPACGKHHSAGEICSQDLGGVYFPDMNLQAKIKVEEDPYEMQVGGDHYKDCAIQPGHYIVQNNLGWYEGNIIKYTTRHGKKGGPEDIRKVIHYARLLLKEKYGENE